jgi:hypothetical protein
MSAGLKIFDANGVLQVDMGSRLFRLLSVVNVGTSDGSVTIIGADNINVQILSTADKKPDITINQDTGVVSWVFDPAYRTNTQLVIMEF